jgi:hypothetical protein
MIEPKKMARERELIERLYERLITRPLVPFPSPRAVLDAPSGQGVYVIYRPDGRVLHVGSTPTGLKGIAQRLKNHMSNASSFSLVHLAGDEWKLRNGYAFRCIVVKNHRTRALLEHLAIGKSCPAHLGTRKRGVKTPLIMAVNRKVRQLSRLQRSFGRAQVDPSPDR